MSPENREEQASLYALGLLEGEELTAFQRALAADPALVSLVAECENAALHLAPDGSDTSPLPARKDALLLKVAELRRAAPPAVSTRTSLWWLPWALAAGLAIFAGITWKAAKTAEHLAGEVSRRSVASAEELTKRTSALTEQNSQLLNQLVELGAERTRLEIRNSALEGDKNRLNLRVTALETRDPLNDIRTIAFVPQPSASRGGQIAALWDTRRQAGVLDLSKLPAPAPDKDYQIWILSPDMPTPVNAGVVSTNASRASFRAPRPLTQITALALSLEPKGGSGIPSTPFIYLGKF